MFYWFYQLGGATIRATGMHKLKWYACPLSIDDNR